MPIWSIDTPAPGAANSETDLQMVAEVLPHVGQVDATRNPDRLELILGSDPGQHQDLRRAHGPSAEDDLLVRVDHHHLAIGGPVLDPGRPQAVGAILQDHPGHVGHAAHIEIRPLVGLTLEKGVIRAGALAVAGRGLQQRHHALGTATIAAVVVAARDSGRLGRLDELLRTGDQRRTDRHTQRAAHVVRVGVHNDVATRGEALALLEEGKDLVIGPSKGSFGRPAVEVTRVSPDIGHVVDPRRPAEHLAPRHHHPTAIETEATPAGIGRVHPVRLGVLLQCRTRSRHRLVRRWHIACLDEHHATTRILREPGGDHGAGRTSTNHDEISHLVHSPTLPSYPASTTGRRSRGSGPSDT